MRIIGDNSIFIENSLHSIEEHLIVGGISGGNRRISVSVEYPHDVYRCARDSDLDHFDICADVCDGLHAQFDHDAVADLMVGIVIDDAIVVLENIYRYVEEKGMDPYQAAIEGTREIGLAVLATTLSLMAVFVPIGFMQGIVGRFMSSFGLTASFAVGVSLIVSFTLTPMLAARLDQSSESRKLQSRAVKTKFTVTEC